jgi:hypothetical protein
MMTHVPGFSSGKLSRAAARAGRAALVGVGAGAIVALTASASFAGGVPTDVTADSWVSKAKADVFKANLGGQLGSTGAYVAVNDGVLQQVEGVKVPELPLIGSQNILAGSALAQDAVASDSGFSAACAAILGEGGAVKIGADKSCLLSGDGKFSISLGSVKQLGLGSVLGGQIPGLDVLNLDDVTGNLGLLKGLPVASDLNLPVLSDLDLSALDLSTLKALPTDQLPDVGLKIVGRALSSECLATPTSNFGRSTPLKAQLVATVAGQDVPLANLPSTGAIDLDLNTLLTKVQGVLPTSGLPAVGELTQVLGTVLATLPTDALQQVQLAKVGVGVQRESVGKISVTALSVDSKFPGIAQLRLGQVECNSSASPSAKDIPQDRQSAQGPSSDKTGTKVDAKVDAAKPEAKVAAKGEGSTVNANITPAGQGTPIAPIGWSAAAAVLLAGIALAGFKLRQARKLGTASTEN